MTGLQIFKPVPDSITYALDSWSQKQTPEGMKMQIANAFTFTGLDGGIVSVDGKARIESDDDNTITFMDQQMPVDGCG